MVPPDASALTRGLGQFNATLLAQARPPWVVTFDLAARMPQSWEFFVDDCHYTRAGNQRVATELLPVIADLLRHRPAVAPR